MNKVYLIGNLTRDPEMRSTSTGIPVCNFSIAVNRRFRNAQTGQQETDFFNIVAWRQLAELCSRYLAKGRKVAVVGSIQTRSYEAQDGSKRTAFDMSPTRSSSFPLQMRLLLPPAIITLPCPPPPLRACSRLRALLLPTADSRRWMTTNFRSN